MCDNRVEEIGLPLTKVNLVQIVPYTNRTEELLKLETFKTTIRCAVIVFVAIAGGISFAGLSPTHKADAEALASDSKTEETKLTSAKKKKVLTVELNTTS